MFEGAYNNNWVFGLSLGMFVYAGMGVLLPELDTSIGNSVGQGFNKWICLVLDIKIVHLATYPLIKITYFRLGQIFTQCLYPILSHAKYRDFNCVWSYLSDLILWPVLES